MMARSRTNSSLSACLSALFGGVVLPSLLISAEYYTVTGPNVRADSCSPRCVDSDSPGHWSCSDVVDAAGTALSVCDTFELDAHTCHFHMMSQQEVGECLADNQLNFIIMGQSNGVGLMSSIFSWVNLDVNGLVKWRGGAASGGSIEQMMDLSAAMDKTTTGSKLNFFRCTQLQHMMDALDGLTYAGRQNEKAYLLMNVGSYFKSVEDWRAAIIQVLDRIKAEFPHLTIFMVGYSDAGKQPFNDVMLEVIDTYGASIQMHYVDTFNMLRSPKAPKTTGSHWVHMVNLQIFNRVLAFACASRGTAECEEQVIGSSNCQWDPLQTSWYFQWFRQCNYMTYTSNSAPFSTPPEPAGLSPEAPAAVPEGSVITVPTLGPNSSPSTQPTTPTASDTATTPADADSCPNTVQGSICQGKGFAGSRCCGINLECKYIDEDFSACFPYGYEVNGVTVANSPCDDVFCSGRGYCTVDSLKRPQCNCEDGVSISRYGNCLLPTDPGMQDKSTSTVNASGTADTGSGGDTSSSSASSTGIIVIAAVGSCVAFLCLGSVGVYLRIRTDRKLNPPPMLVQTKEMA